jgi:hypothetical protein
MTFDDQCGFWIGENAVLPTLTNVNKTCFWPQANVTYSVVLNAGVQYPILLLHSQGGGSIVVETMFKFSGPGVAETSDGTGYFYSKPMPFAISIPSVSANKAYLNTTTNRVNLVNTGYQLNVVAEIKSNLFTDANGPYIALKNVATGLYIIHAMWWINELAFKPNFSEFAWKFVYDPISKKAYLYTSYESALGGNYMGYDTTSTLLKINKANVATSNNLLSIFKV